jgi:Rrf2 family protein
MIITREIDYALKILRNLSSGELTPTPEICRLENLPIHFVYRILKKLDNAGIVDITRGKDGGAQLACDLDKLNVFELVIALGDRRYVSACTAPGYDCEYRKAHDGNCGVHDHLEEMQDELDSLLRSRSISYLLNDV